MALHSGVSGGGAVVKPAPSAAGRRRARGALVRCRAYVWSKEDLARLDVLARRPRETHEEPDPVQESTELSAIIRGQMAVEKDCKLSVRLKRVAKSDGSMLLRQAPAPEKKDDETKSLRHSPVQPMLQSPVQSALSSVTSVAATLIDLSL